MNIWEVDTGQTPAAGMLPDGSPDPAYAEALGLLPAPRGRRAAAAAIDTAVHLLLQLPFWIFTAPLLIKLLRDRITWFGFTNHPDLFWALLLGGISIGLTTAYTIAQLALHGRKGLTLGKGLLGIRSINVATLERPGFWRVVLRALVVWGPLVVPLVTLAFLVSPLLDKEGRGRGWHDRIGRTWLVDVRAGLHPYDDKRMRIARKMQEVKPRKERPALRPLTSAAGDPMMDFRPSERLSAGVLGGADLGPREPDQALPAGPGGPAQPGGRLATPASPPEQPAQQQAQQPAQPSAPAPDPTPAPPPAPAPAPQPAPRTGRPETPLEGPTLVPATSSQAPAPASPDVPAPSSASATPASTSASTSTSTSAPSRAARFVLGFDTGQEVLVDAPLLLGRNPEASDPHLRPVAIADEEYSVSKAHLFVRPTAGGVEMIDRGSSNGTTITREGVPTPLVPGQAVVARPGDVVHVGQRAAQVRLG